jgi:hypothetical protein
MNELLQDDMAKWDPQSNSLVEIIIGGALRSSISKKSYKIFIFTCPKSHITSKMIIYANFIFNVKFKSNLKLKNLPTKSSNLFHFI